MQTIKGSLGLAVREQTKNCSPTVKFAPKSIQKWITTLPMTNVGEVSRSVYNALSEANRSIVSYDQRFKGLLVFEKTIAYINQSLRKHYLGRSVVLSVKQKKVAALAQAMDMEMAIGYKSVIESIVSRNSFFTHKKTLIPAIYFAMDYLCKVIIRCYQLYSQQPRGVWREIHKLYAYAQKHNYHQVEITVARDKEKKHNIEGLYLRIILLTIANPYQLRQNDIDLVFASLDDLITMIHLEPTSTIGHDYVIDLDKDYPPLHQPVLLKQKQKMGGNLLKVEADPLIDYLKEHLRRVPTDSSQFTRYGNYAFNPIILRHLVSSLGNMTDRSFSRTHSQGNLEIAVGLAATHHIISEFMTKPEDDYEMHAFSGSFPTELPYDMDDMTIDGYVPRTQPSENTFTKEKNSKDVWDKIVEPDEKETDQTLYGASSPPNSFATNFDSINYETISASIINVSPGGYCLALPPELPSQIQTGEIVGILRNESTTPYWSISTVRWIKCSSNGNVQLGLKVIAPSAIPIRTQVRDSKMNSQSFQRSLLIPEIKGLGQPDTIITPPVPYRVKHRVRYIKFNEDKTVVLSQLAHSTHSYKQFEFESLAATHATQPKEQHKETESNWVQNDDSDIDDFDSVWDLI